MRQWMYRPAEHDWAGGLTANQLVQLAAQDAYRCADRIRLRFFSPTAFCLAVRGGRLRWMSVPLPELVFGSLFRRLQAFYAGLELRDSVRDFVRSQVSVGRKELCTRMLCFQHHRARVAGSVGVCEYLLPKDSSSESRLLLHLLAGFAFYSGVGVRTVWGMGQARREPLSNFTYRGS